MNNNISGTAAPCDQTAQKRLLSATISAFLGCGALFGATVAVGQSATCSENSVARFCVNQDSSTLPGASEAGDRFGAALAFGDFNADGFDDLAAGSPGENGGSGAVHILYGSAAGLQVASADLLLQDDVSGGDTADNEAFGRSLVAADFDGDGFDDLAIGVPNERIEGRVFGPVCYGALDCKDAGEIVIVRGSESGVRTQDPLRVNHAYDGAHVGRSMVALAPDPFGKRGIASWYGNAPVGFLGPNQPQSVMMAGPDVLGEATTLLNTKFGCSNANDANNPAEIGDPLAATTLGGLVPRVLIGAPGCAFGGANAVGQVSLGNNFRLSPSDFGAANVAGGRFGDALASGAFSGLGVDGIAIGAPGRRSGGGEVYVAHSFGASMKPLWQQLISRADFGEPVSANDRFGASLSVLDANGDSFVDLLIGAPFEGGDDRGGLYLMAGSSSGLAPHAQSPKLRQGDFGGLDAPHDHFGNVFATGDVNGDGVTEIAVGVPGKDVGNKADAGLIYVATISAL